MRYLKFNILICCGFILFITYAVAGDRWPVNQYGQNCLVITDRSSGPAGYGNSKHTRYNLELSNRCNRSFSIKVHTNAGWTGYMSVPAGRSGKWFCTDDLYVNKDCNGIESLEP